VYAKACTPHVPHHNHLAPATATLQAQELQGSIHFHCKEIWMPFTARVCVKSVLQGLLALVHKEDATADVYML
jgi:hypothetical protein